MSFLAHFDARAAPPTSLPDALTHRQIADKLGVPFHDLSATEARERLRDGGLPDWFVADLLWLYADMASGGLSEVTDTVRELTGQPPRSVDEFLASRRMTYPTP